MFEDIEHVALYTLTIVYRELVRTPPYLDSTKGVCTIALPAVCEGIDGPTLGLSLSPKLGSNPQWTVFVFGSQLLAKNCQLLAVPGC